jgi:sporulation protein YlmC with PRC-barrel domain
MKSIHFLSISSLTLLASVGMAIAANPDPTGKTELGVDISQAGTSADDHQKFVATLSPEQQANLHKACLVIVAQPSTHSPGVVTFCNDVNQMPKGTMAATPAAASPVMIGPDAMLTYNLIGLEVYNGANEDVGEIKDLVIDSGQVVGYVVSVGGFLGMGEHYSLLAPSAVNITYDQANAKWLAMANVSKDQLKNAPEFKYEGKFKHSA